MESSEFEGQGPIDQGSIVLAVGVSRDAESLFCGLARRFESLGFHLETGHTVKLRITSHDEDSLLKLAAKGEFDAFSPTSTISLLGEPEQPPEVNQRPFQVGSVTVFAVSPVLLAVSPARAQQMAYPGQSLSWSSCFRAAEEDEEFRWMHPHPRSVMGQYTLKLAQAFALEGTKGDHGEEQDIVRRKISLLESRVVQYGPSDLDVAKLAFSAGNWHVDAFVSQEHVIISSFADADLATQPVVVYPEYLNVFMDHPLVTLSFLEQPKEVTEAYKLFRNYVLSADAQPVLMQYGFRTADQRSRIYFSGPAAPSSLIGQLYLPSQEFSMELPNAAELKKMSLIFAKHSAAVYLLADTSESMEGQKMEGAQEGLCEFLARCAPDDQIGLIAFSDDAHLQVQLGFRDDIDYDLRSAIDHLSASGWTALLDAVFLAQEKLREPISGNPIRAIVLLTDGKENVSKATEANLERAIRVGNTGRFPVTVFAVAYGEDADVKFLERLVAWTYGAVLPGTRSNIVEIYKRIASFF